MAILTNMDNPLEVLVFHGELSSDWEDAVEVTDHAVPEGAPATAHKEQKPRTYSLRLIMNDSPLGPVDPAPGGERFDSIVEGWLGRNLLAKLRYFSENTGRVENLHITSARRGRTNVGRTVYDVQLKQVRTARAASVRLPPPKRQRKPTTNPPTDKGPAPTTQAPPKLQSANAEIYQGVVTGYKDSLKYRLTNTDYLVGEQTTSPDTATLYRSYLPAGPAPVEPPPADLLYSPIPP
jgi:hypothetical protein